MIGLLPFKFIDFFLLCEVNFQIFFVSRVAFVYYKYVAMSLILEVLETPSLGLLIDALWVDAGRSQVSKFVIVGGPPRALLLEP